VAGGLLKKEEVYLTKVDIEGAECDVIPESLISPICEAESRIEVSVGSCGPWFDLSHETERLPDGKVEFDQYSLICGRRSEANVPLAVES